MQVSFLLHQPKHAMGWAHQHFVVEIGFTITGKPSSLTYGAFLCDFQQKAFSLFHLFSLLRSFRLSPGALLLSADCGNQCTFFAGQGVCPRHDACSTISPGHVLHLLPEVIYNNMLSNTNSFQVAQQYVLHMVWIGAFHTAITFA